MGTRLGPCRLTQVYPNMRIALLSQSFALFYPLDSSYLLARISRFPLVPFCMLAFFYSCRAIFDRFKKDEGGLNSPAFFFFSIEFWTPIGVLLNTLFYVERKSPPPPLPSFLLCVREIDWIPEYRLSFNSFYSPRCSRQCKRSRILDLFFTTFHCDPLFRPYHCFFPQRDSGGGSEIEIK